MSPISAKFIDNKDKYKLVDIQNSYIINKSKKILMFSHR